MSSYEDRKNRSSRPNITLLLSVWRFLFFFSLLFCLSFVCCCQRDCLRKADQSQLPQPAEHHCIPALRWRTPGQRRRACSHPALTPPPPPRPSPSRFRQRGNLMRVSCHGDLVCSPNLIGGGFSSINLDSLSVSSHSRSQQRRRLIFCAFPRGADHESASRCSGEEKNTEHIFRSDPVVGNEGLHVNILGMRENQHFG